MTDEWYIKRCLELAEKAKGNVAPNPMVGAVLVHEERIIGEGWHQQYGKAHAEVNCIDNVRIEDRDLIPQSTMYVSLEPCSHFGKTPPCAERIIKEGIKKVVICSDDPFEKVDGRGFKLLIENGVEVKRNVLEAGGKWLNRRFFTFHASRRPYIILKWAQTRNGLFAPSDHSRLQLSNKHATQLVHKWRTEETAIMVGFTTALNDNPQLTSRYYEGRQPLRIVLDKELKLPHSYKLFNNDTATWVINEKKEDSNHTVRFVKKTFGENLLSDIFEELHQAAIQSLIIEGGAKLLESFIFRNLWDEARVITANVHLKRGLTAPTLFNAKHLLQTELMEDVLDVYLHSNNPYEYIKGMSL